ncbi:helix-turn-helix transcriptional regulator [Paractinoplanes rishiriensis]|uniref:LuxR family transcriptional regulator n=1 Tax=Paractinoplanes rishiriensis TaxID=1050105 RepID=A0A919K561_9ACTN|nr:helix-turn-helix transcriptional regulator [Actinoplanes rishiriensis]GIF01011.1 LuxR family transcriptional regulator [Actinoplanes rishiriensis]
MRNVVVGRAGELSRYERGLERLRAGHGGVVAFRGEPGIGKTRLLAAFAGAGTETLYPATLVDALAEARRVSGVAICLDDLHRLPPSSAPLLGELILLAAGRPLLLVLAYRPRQVDAAIGAVLGRAEASAALSPVHLPALDLAATRELLADLPDIGRIHAEGGGNPLYMKLLAGSAAEAAGGLVAEIAALGGAELRTAQAAAALGGQCTLDLLIEVSADDPDEAVRAVDALLTADVLRLDDGERLAFRHRVVADVVYRYMATAERWTRHRRIDEVLARRGAPAPQRARHIAAAGLRRPEHAEVLLTAAAGSLDADPVSTLRWAGAAGALMTAGDPRRGAADTLVARSRLLIGDVAGTRDSLLSAFAHAPSGAAAVYAGRALTLLGQYDEAGAILRDGLAGVADDPDSAALLSDLASLLSDDMDFASATRHATTATGIARRHGDRLREAAALAEHAWARGRSGDLDSARLVVGDAATLVDAMSDAALVRDLRCLYRVGLTEILAEQVVDAHRHLARGVRLCRRTGQAHLLAPLLAALGDAQLRFGQMAAAVRTLDEAVFQAGRDELVPYLCMAAVTRGMARFWLGEDDAAVLADAEAVETRCADARWSWAVLSRNLAGQLTALAGDPKQGSRILLQVGGGPQLHRLMPLGRVRTWESLTMAALALGDAASADRYAGLAAQHPTVGSSATRRGVAGRALIRTQGRSAHHAELALAAQSTLAAFAGAHHWLDLAGTELVAGEAFLAAQRPDLAAEHLDRAADHAVVLGSGRLTRLVTAAQQRLRLPSVPPWAVLLTQREREVAELAATGLTSAQIARRLFLSVRTVDTHLGRAYRKLGVSSRAALAMLAADPRPR